MRLWYPSLFHGPELAVSLHWVLWMIDDASSKTCHHFPAFYTANYGVWWQRPAVVLSAIWSREWSKWFYATVFGIFSERELRYMSLSVRLSVVCDVRAPYSGYWNFRQCFYTICYFVHLCASGKNFTEIIPGNPSVRGLNRNGVAKYSDFGPFQGYISETVQNRR